MKIYVLLSCVYDGDSYLIDDIFVAAGESIPRLIALANALAYGSEIYLPGQECPDDGQYGDKRTRYRIIETELLAL